jgi:hypothetical protein
METSSPRLRNWCSQHDRANRHLPQDDLGNGSGLQRDTVLSSKHRYPIAERYNVATRKPLSSGRNLGPYEIHSPFDFFLENPAMGRQHDPLADSRFFFRAKSFCDAAGAGEG